MRDPHDRPRRPRPDQAIQARRRAADAKALAVETSVKTMARAGIPITRNAVAAHAAVSRTFTYTNERANAAVAAAQARTRAHALTHNAAATEQTQASWRERALNAEDQLKAARRELADERRLTGDLLAQLRDPDGTWITHERDRLLAENETLRQDRNALLADNRTIAHKLEAARANLTRAHQHRTEDQR